jgi:hypothetical protein
MWHNIWLRDHLWQVARRILPLASHCFALLNVDALVVHLAMVEPIIEVLALSAMIPSLVPVVIRK